MVHRHGAAVRAIAIAAAVCSFAGFATVATAATSSGANGDLAFAIHSEVPVIAVMGSDGDVTPLAVTGVNGSPEWSPDGARLAYEAPAVGMPWNDHIWIMDADGSNRTEITAGHPTETQWQPSWSPDGTRIAFSASSPEGCSHNDIWVMDADGSDATNITNTPDCAEYDSAPEWSPDGEMIVFQSGRSGSPAVWSMRPDGSDPRFLTENGHDPSFSPDGAMIVFSRRCDLWITNADGGVERQLTDFDRVDWCAASPDWSPDGTRIALALGPSSSYRETEIYTVGVDGTGTLRLTNNLVAETMPDWRPMAEVPQPPSATPGLVDPATGEWHLRNWAGTVNSFFYGNPRDIPFMGDWDCDGIDTPGLFRQSDAFAYLRDHNTQGLANVRFFFGNPSDVPLAGDFDGDGCDTVSIYRPSEQRFYIVNDLGRNDGGLGAADYSFIFGNPGDKPVVGDWDGDGTDEVGLHRESTGFFYWRNTLTTGVAEGEIFFGDPGDRFVAGDWGAVDGEDTPGLFRPSDMTFYFRHTLTQGIADSSLSWTEAGTDGLPVAGRFGLGLPLPSGSDKVKAGQTVYSSTCVACHGPAGAGISGLGPPLVNTQFMASLNEAEFIKFIDQGRESNDPRNTTGVAMPPLGGNPNLTDADLAAVYAYLQSLN